MIVSSRTVQKKIWWSVIIHAHQRQDTGSARAHRRAIECGALPFEFGVLVYDKGSLEFNVPKVSYLYHGKCGYVPRQKIHSTRQAG